MSQTQSVLVANRGEIAIRVLRAASELRMRTVAIYANEDRFALHRFKADESYLVGAGKKPVEAYLDIHDIIRIARDSGVDAIHPGYGFLSENPEFAEACQRAGLLFIGPQAKVMRTLGNKVSARELAERAGVPVVPASKALPRDAAQVREIAEGLGYPLMLKASWGGGGRGMRAIHSASDLPPMIEVARREAAAAFGNDELYLEKLVERAQHVEVQVLGDLHGNLVHLFERDCSVQRRNQKVVERAPAPYLDPATRARLCATALRLAKAVDYTHAGTVEFLLDADRGEFYFIEVNPRIQVEHTVTEQVTGVDLVKAQIRISQGARIGESPSFCPKQEDLALRGHALQCRITTEDPSNNFTPDYGTINAYRSAGGFGIRLDAGTAYAGAVITPYYDSLLVKVTAFGQTSDEAAGRMDRALREFRIRGLATNIQFLENVINHPRFRSGACTTKFIDTTPELFELPARKDRASRLLRFLAEVTVNGHPEVKGRKLPALPVAQARMPSGELTGSTPAGTRSLLRELGPEGLRDWMLAQQRVLLTDTTMRDAHQSLLATRMRTYDMMAIAPYYAERLPQLFSVECWGGATFDVALRFLKEDPWDRLSRLRAAIPNILFQMLLRASNAVGYTNYPDNVVRHFVEQANERGVDVFRVFDALNNVDNMRVAMDAVRETGAVCEAAVCYTGDLFDGRRDKYNLEYYLRTARELAQGGAHILGIKDMAGVCRPRAVATLVRALKAEVGLPIHFHTHDTSGIAAASVLAAVEAGCDAVDGAMDALSGLTSQPNLGSLVAALAGGERDCQMERSAMREISNYWEGVRRQYLPFEADMRSGTADVYRHEMPGGQYTNLREQARALGLAQRWPEVADRYAEVNMLFGDIVKVTPTSKVVGDMALFMVANDLTAQDVLDPAREIDFPASVVSLMRGELGFPAEGFPEALMHKVLRGQKPLAGRAGALLPSADLEAERAALQRRLGQDVDSSALASHMMYPKVYADYVQHRREFGDVSLLPTGPFFYGLQDGEELTVRIERGKVLQIRQVGRSTGTAESGETTVFFELNGQPRMVGVQSLAASGEARARSLAEEGNPLHVGAPIPGMVANIAVEVGQKVERGEALLSLEAMKMETVLTSSHAGTVREIHVRSGQTVAAKELLLEFAPDADREPG